MAFDIRGEEILSLGLLQAFGNRDDACMPNKNVLLQETQEALLLCSNHHRADCR
jgi:hypothetical protein